jgi:methyl-accepting chemotaxis protein
MSAGKVVGVTYTALALDNNFLDGIKKVTGLEVGVYGGETLSATTISDLRGETRPIGIKNANKTISNNVLTKGSDFQGQISLLNTSYFSVFHPLKDADNSVVGMLLAGRPAASIFAAASQSIELTFLITVLLIILSIFPSYFVARYITNQLK